MTGMCPVPVLDPRGLRPRCEQRWFPFKAPGKTPPASPTPGPLYLWSSTLTWGFFPGSLFLLFPLLPSSSSSSSPSSPSCLTESCSSCPGSLWLTIFSLRPSWEWIQEAWLCMPLLRAATTGPHSTISPYYISIGFSISYFSHCCSQIPNKKQYKLGVVGVVAHCL